MDGHQVAQERVSNPALTWLRKVALAVDQDGTVGQPLTASAIGEVCENHGIDIPGLQDVTDEDQRKRKIGIVMGRVFKESDVQELDGFTVNRSGVEQKRPDGAGGNYIVRQYLFQRPQTAANMRPQQAAADTPIDIEKDTFPMTNVSSTAPTASTAEDQSWAQDMEELAF